MFSVFDTDELPATRRFALWRDQASNLFLPVTVRSSYEEAFHYRTARSAIDGMPIGSSSVTNLNVRREARQIGDPDTCPLSIYIPTSGKLAFVQAGYERCVRPGELSFIDSARPYEQDIANDFGYVWFHVPKDRLPSHFSRVEALAGLKLESSNPYAKLAMDFIRSVAAMAGQLNGENARSIGEQALDLLAMAVEHDIGTPTPDGQARRAAILHYAKTFIAQNLPDSDLSLDRVAAALGVSSRYLSGLFSDAETPYRTYLRELRLERCARDLAAPRLAHRSVTEVALSWGFVDSAHFSRCFREQFALSPSEYRAAGKSATLSSDDLRSVPHGSDE
ncbi:helix-turn-helix domain-containing protein [Paraburkholderia oxyphila]|uniref:helix-turn-helix domain-containing protein n=1 Tax=Paraburkholderia oxyphila TaxID=614212 RepID=UPI000481438B|nr:helix-turn-helix domain-containing protein [Paraburkholderia oxyphila]